MPLDRSVLILPTWNSIILLNTLGMGFKKPSPVNDIDDERTDVLRSGNGLPLIASRRLMLLSVSTPPRL